MSKKIKKLLSLIIVLALVFQMLPMSVFAEEYGEEGKSETSSVESVSAPAVTDETESYSPIEEYTAKDVLCELTELRSESEKYFLMDNGANLAVSYPEPVHFLDNNGEYAEIDSTLVLCEAGDSKLPASIAVADDDSDTPASDNTVTSDAEEITEENFDTAVGSGEQNTAEAVTPDSAAANAEDVIPIADDDASAFLGMEYRNKAGAAGIRLSATNRADYLAAISYKDYEIAMMPITGDDEGKAETIIGTVLENDVKLPEDSLDAAISVKNITSSLLYKGLFPNADVMYTAASGYLKEYLIINSASDTYDFAFNLSVGELSPECNEDGDIQFFDESRNIIYTIPAGFMRDAEGEYSDSVTYKIEELEKGKYTFRIIADADWINDAERVFPITIDPTASVTALCNSDNSYTLEMAAIHSKSSSGAQLYTISEIGGYGTDKDNYARTIVRVNQLPTLPDNCIIVSATLRTYLADIERKNMNSVNIEAHPLDYNYKTSNKYWVNGKNWATLAPHITSEVLDYVTVTSTSSKSYNFNLTREAIKWYADPGSNYGISLQIKEESSMNANKYFRGNFATGSNSSSSIRPSFVIEYRNTVGVEGYYSYQSASIDGAGTSYINDVSGNLCLIENDVSSSSTINPFGLSHVYNSAYSSGEYNSVITNSHGSYSGMKLGKGWMLDIQQTCSYFESSKAVYADSDGTIHYLKELGAGNYFYDEDGLGLMMQWTDTTTDYNCNLSNSSGTKLRFVNRMLSYTEDANGNRITYNINSSKQITSVVRKNYGCSNETLATFTYDANGYLTSVTDASNKTTTYTYNSSGYLTGITRPDGSTVTYTYSGGKLASAQDNETGYKISYTYDAQTGRVSSYTESAGGTNGACISVDSSNSITTYRSCGNDRALNNSDDILTSYVFDYAGRTITAYSTNADKSILYGADGASYTTNSGTSKQNNRVLTSSVIGKQAINYLHDSGFEQIGWFSDSAWTWSGSGSASIESSDTRRSGLRILKFSNNSTGGTTYTTQTVSGLEPSAWYVFSGYVNTSGATAIENDGVYLQAGNVRSNSVTWATATGVWERMSVAAQADASGSITVQIVANNVAGDVYFDDFQLEDSQNGSDGVPSNVNYILDSNMARNDGAWTLDANAQQANATGLNAPSDKVIRLTSSPTTQPYAKQDVTMYLPSSETYVVSGWAKANSVPLHNSRTFRIWVQLYYEGDTTPEDHFQDFCADSTEWQYVSFAVVPKETERTVGTLCVYLSYYNNANTAEFTNISLTRSPAQTMKYDDEGNLVSVASPGTDAASAQYSGSDLTRMSTPGYGDTNYTYDSKHNLTAADYDGLTSNMTYGSSGNVTQQRVTSQLNNETRIMKSTSAYSNQGNLRSGSTSYGNFKSADGTYVDHASTTYTYSTNISKQTGQPTSVTNAKQVTTNTSYDENNGRANNTTVANSSQVSYTYDRGRLESLTVSDCEYEEPSQSYKIRYDDFGNTESVSVGSYNGDTFSGQTIASYVYDDNNGNLKYMTYGGTSDNDHVSIKYDYDDLGRVIRRTTGKGNAASDAFYNSPTYSDRYSYNGEGQAYRRIETGLNYSAETYYNYDTIGRLIGMSRAFGTNSTDNHLNIAYTYNNYNQMSGYSFSIPGIAENVNTSLEYFTNDTHACFNGSPSHVGLPNGANVWYNNSDNFARLHAQRVGPVKYEYTYNDSSVYASNLVSGIAVQDGAHNDSPLFNTSYEYDVLGNIVSQTTNGNTVTYEYDELNQLTKAGNDEFTYDSRGNIVTKTSGGTTHNYTYSTGDWKDQLTKYDNHTIAYDASGNPLSYYNGADYTFTWVNGRQLASTAVGSNNVSYAYDGDGLRTVKTVNGETTYYAWSGGILLAQWKTNSSNAVTEKMVFLYDTGTTPVGFLHKISDSESDEPLTENTDNEEHNEYSTSWDAYYFAKNAQGDVLYVYDANMNVVASYTYDAWGKVLNSTGTMADVNPIRYRSYYFDSDTALYYLQSRYYDPEIGRFINADVFVSTDITGPLSANMYAYCENNPVNASDPNGEFWHIVAGAAIGGIVGGISAALSGGDAADILIGVGAGMLGGALTASGVGVAGQIIGGAAISMASNAAQQTNKIIKGKQESFDLVDMAIDGIIGGVCGARGGSGASFGNVAGIEAAEKNLFKQGFSKSSLRYFVSQAHKQGGVFVYEALAKSSAINAVGSALMVMKGKIQQWIH